jgi:hypothetical protein
VAVSISELPSWAVIPLFAWVVVVVSCVGGFVEAILMQRLWPPVFYVGHVVLHEECSISLEDRTRVEVGRVYATSRGKFRAASRNEIVFRENFWRPFEWHTPFPIKGRVTWADETARAIGSLEGRIPVASTVLMGSLLIFATTISVAGMFGLPRVAGRLGVLAAAAFFWSFVAGMYLVSLRIELPRIRGLAQEICERLSPVQ